VAVRKTAEALVRELQKQPGFVDLVISDRGARPQFGFRMRRDKVSAAGLMPAQVALAVGTAIAGTEATQFRDGADRYKVLVMAPERYRNEKSAVLSMPLRGMGGNLQGIALGPAQQVVQNLAKDMLPPGVTLKFSGQGQLMAESFMYMLQALLLAIVIIYMVLAAQFESFLHPVTIMMSLPLSLVGALGSLLITGQTLSIMSFIGVIMLMGLVTKNAILLVDNANQRRAAGVDVTEAVTEAGAVRLRPILMTTAAMIFGMLPVALALGEGSEFRAPMGVTVIGGLVTSTMLTLLVVPAIYSVFEGIRIWLRKVLGKRTAAPQAMPAE
jgi:HAE1 family hydrophobic/amphiphilic exporter-1